MTLTIEVDAALENRLRERAADTGVPFSQMAADALAYALSAWEADAVQDELDAQEARKRLADKSETHTTFAQFEAELDSEREAAR